MVERITHQPYERSVKQMLFNPIGMTSASVTAGVDELQELGPAA